MTEKLYQAMMAGSLPIYIGAPDVERFVPHPSAIVRVESFVSLEALVEYLKELDHDDEKYLQHFEWKRKKEWTPQFAEVLQLTQMTAHCRLAMFAAGEPARWREANIADG